MKDFTLPTALINTLPTAPSAIHQFWTHHTDALAYAGGLLLGKAGLSLATEIADRLQREPVPGRRTLTLVHRFKDLLNLEHVADPLRDESGFFAAISPESVCLDELCLLTEGLNDAINEIEGR